MFSDQTNSKSVKLKKDETMRRSVITKNDVKLNLALKTTNSDQESVGNPFE